MRKLSDELARVEASWSKSEEALKARRAAKVQHMWKDAVEHVYKDAAPHVLAHVNAVYVRDGELMVYMDDGDFRSDVHFRQHLLLLRMRDKYGEEITSFKTFPSRFNMKARHPYAPPASPAAEETPSVPLSPAERAEVERCVAAVEDEGVKKALLRAMVANKEWNKGKS